MIMITFSQVLPVGPGTWIVSLTQSEVRHFAKGHILTKGNRSVIGVNNPQYDSTKQTLSIPVDSIFPFNIGMQHQSVIVDLGSEPQSLRTENEKHEAPDLGIASSLDQPFIEACISEKMPNDMIRLVQQVLCTVRKEHKDKLIEGKGRKWTTSPNNFLAITIQNRNKQFLVSVKADQTRHPYQKISLKKSRAPYCEFHLNAQSQTEDAVSAILRSARQG
ncbi:MAG: hypothetical protein GC185_04190 [Alphaproteobacteria bacterium]|nr:hypothetical protein [Alphaproteobacteria bacterium]